MMRAKMRVDSVLLTEHGEQVRMCAVAAKTYADSGLDEDNTFSKFTPAAEVTMTINNPALAGKVKPGMRLYVEFSEAPA